MKILSRLFGKTNSAETGKTYEVCDASSFNKAAFTQVKVANGDLLICLAGKDKSWGYPIFKRGTEMAPGTDQIKMTYKAKGEPASYGLKEPSGPGQHGGFGG